MTCFCSESAVEAAKSAKPEFAAELANEMRRYGSCGPDCRTIKELERRSVLPARNDGGVAHVSE